MNLTARIGLVMLIISTQALVIDAAKNNDDRFLWYFLFTVWGSLMLILG